MMNKPQATAFHPSAAIKYPLISLIAVRERRRLRWYEGSTVAPLVPISDTSTIITSTALSEPCQQVPTLSIKSFLKAISSLLLSLWRNPTWSPHSEGLVMVIGIVGICSFISNCLNDDIDNYWSVPKPFQLCQNL